MAEKNSSPAPPGSGLVGLALVSLCIIGLISAFFAITCLIKTEPDFVGGGLLLIASAVSFGQLLSGLLRK